ncbi:hypothetical protein LNV23_16235 [Paucibacter sp. DJ1R-11]|uniref:hypothetical protein n=1 Tax=Paucibacter sp. DJ1R-11 TaxID=2893556 RepID=UPI0021E3B2B8|nr:hypothetical protein [Paucibacter sp. DJ1R-11]MCV2365002.1 hypothetical protein [Paucibacter sp. DJ1R-11]
MNNFKDNQPSSSASQEVSPVSGVLSSGRRRRLLQGGLVAAPTLLALTTTPVLACNCKLPSGFSASGNFSQTGSYSCTAPGKTPTGWKSTVDVNNKYFPTNVSKGTTFFSVFGGTDTTTTFWNLLCLSNANSDSRALAVAVYLQSVANAGANFPSVNMVKQMWTSTEGAGRYTVLTAPVLTWSRAEVVVYFKYLTGLATA